MTRNTTKLFRKIEIDVRDKIAVTNLVLDTGQNVPARELKNSDIAFFFFFLRHTNLYGSLICTQIH